MAISALLLVLLTPNGLAHPTTYSQVRLQMPQAQFEPVVGMTERDIQKAGEFYQHPMRNVKSATGDEGEILRKVNSNNGISYGHSDVDTLDSLIEWVNNPWHEASPLQNDIL